MTPDLSQQLRALVDVARPVSAGEAVARSGAVSNPLGDDVPAPARRRVRPLAVAAVAAACAATASGWLVASQVSAPRSGPAETVPSFRPGSMLTESQVRQITSSSAAAAASGGTAEITELREENGIPQDGYEASLTFTGSSIDEKVISVPEPPGSAGSVAVDDRYVNGQFYTYAVGPGGAPQWLHETEQVGHGAPLEFPNPRVLYNAVSSGGAMQYVGTTRVNGVTLYHLVALDPVSIDAATIGSMANSGHFTSFNVWVNARDVIQEVSYTTAAQIGFTTTASTRGSSFGPLATITTTSSALVVFSELGVPQNVTAPSNAVDFQGAG